MCTLLRPELSIKNKYWIEKHRYYELKHFCLQYPTWKKAYNALSGLSLKPADFAIIQKSCTDGDPTAKCAMAKVFYSERIELVEKTAREADSELSIYILRAVTEGLSYNYLKSRLDIPCCKDTYYDRYRKFFWLLNNTRN